MDVRTGIVWVALLGLVGSAQARQVVISEVMASNATTLTDEDGDTPDWIELYNAGAEAVSLAGWTLTDDPADPYAWELPGLTLAPGEYLLVLASGKDRVRGVGSWRTVVTRGDTWRYQPTRTTADASWTEPGFDDSGWPEGPSGFGYGDGDDATVVGQMTALYARRAFEVDDASAVIEAVLHMDYDDGFVAYLNGVEIARANLGAPGSPTAYWQTTTAEHEALLYRGLPPEPFAVPDATGLLVDGTNLLAVEVHNVTFSSTDLSLIPFLSLASADGPVSYDGLAEELRGLISVRLHTGFRIAAGETVCLTAPAAAMNDCLEVPDSPSDVAIGRDPATGALGFFAKPTPGEPNAAIAYSGRASAPVLSHGSGFFTQPFTLTLAAAEAGARIAYTFDGSDPEPIGPLSPREERIGSTTVVRAQALVPGMLPSRVVTRTYLFEPERSMPVVSLVTDPDLLWDYETGIYVMGPGAEANFPHFGANFWQDWEIPVHFEWFDPDGAPVYAADAGTGIYGGWSRGSPQKSMALYARADYGPSAFDHPFFANRPYTSYQNLVLRNSGNDWNRSMLRDGFMQTLVEDTAIDWMAYRPSAVYLNGEYWGLLNAREKINEHYVASVGGVDPDAIDLLEYRTGAGAVPLHGSSGHYDDLIRYLEQTDLTTDAAYAEVGRRMDLDNWIDYQLAQIYFDNRDWPGNNSKTWRAQTAEGRWRWILYDTDFGFGIWNRNAWSDNTLAFASAATGPAWPNPPWSTVILRRLTTNARFRRSFVNRWADYLNHHVRPDRVVAVLDSLAAAIEPEMARHADRWGMGLSQWQGELEIMRTFARNRPDAMTGHLRSAFGLSGPAPLSVEVAGEAGGTIVVNRLAVGRKPWTGLYFAGVSVPVTAVPDAGYRFAGWTGTVESPARTVDVMPSGSAVLVAHFVEDAIVPSDVVLNEIQYHASDAFPGEDWVELHNVGAEDVDLAGWTLSDGDAANVFPVPPGVTLPAGGYAVLCQDPQAFAAVYGPSTCTGGWTFGLSAAGETVYLRNAAGVLVDSVAYDDGAPWPAAADGQGMTLELVDPLSDNALAASWQASSTAGGTPGARNSVATGSEAPPEVPGSSPRVTLYPNPFAGAATLYVEGEAGAEAVVEVYDVLGRRIERIPMGRLQAGPNALAWTPGGRGSGVLLVRLLMDGRVVASTRGVRIR